MSHLTVTAIDTDPQFAGQDCAFHLRMKDAKQPVQDINFSFQHQTSDLKSIIDDNGVTLYAFAQKRGYFRPGRVTIQSGFPFGLYKVWTHVDFDFNVLVYPKVLHNALPLALLEADNRAQYGNSSKLGVDEFSTLKTYQVGESLKSVAWKQLAQGRGWLSKQFEQTAGGDIQLDVSTMSQYPLEMALSYITFQIIELDKKQQRYALALPNKMIEVGIGSRHKQQCLTALALYKRS
ncbi:DUF58 domain-containing protein [Psychromonas sp. psych-6C06]|uniref:DUF58 domain-containing protein n=1 Tax=Psychromonas sp. psych-6C06 TaxID=2058089 RepID=UPI001EE6C95A|nr:DUF58 domain-containing protein [Psychromonas sp. psych-6C06]